jgi:hypothetical protein
MQATIYIRKENQARWDEIKDKSAWVNAYLEKSPPNSRVLAEGLEPVSTPIIPKTTPVTKAADVLIGNMEKAMAEFAPETKDAKTNDYMSRLKIPTCKVHGSPLDDRGRCLQKGCKYA